MTLTGEYQFIGRSNEIKNQNNQHSYYLLLYAKTSGNPATGVHTVSVKSRLVTTKNYFYGFVTSGNATIEGVSVFSWSWYTEPGSDWPEGETTEGGVTYARGVDLREGSTTINVGYGKTKDISISATFTNHATDWGYLPQTKQATVSATVTLPIIGGASEITSVSSVTLGKTCNVQWVPMAASFRYKLAFVLGSFSYTTPVLHPNTTAAYSYPFDTNAYFDQLAEQITENPPTGNAKVTLYTYTDSNASIQIGDADTKSFSVTVPNNGNTAPAVSMALTPVHDLASKFAGLYIQGRSRVRASITGTGKYGASIRSTYMTVNGASSDGLTSGYLDASGDVPVVGYATDSRGFTGSNSQTIRVIAYSSPAVLPHSDDDAIKCGRCDANGNYVGNGAYLRIRARRSYYPVVSGNAQMNFCLIRYRIRDEGSSFSEWRTILSADAGTDNVDTGVMSLGLSPTKSYTVELEAVDDITSSTPVELFISTDNVSFHLPKGGYGVGIGKYSEGNGFECAYPAYFYKGIYTHGSDQSLEERIAALEAKISTLS